MQHDRLERLRSRCMIDAVTASCAAYLKEQSPKIYMGVDPTSPSLHLGNLQGFVVAKFLASMGCEIIILLGGFTAAIGDPSGKTAERNRLDEQVIFNNSEKITAWIRRFMGRDVRIVNNADWLSFMPLKDYLRDFGGCFRMGPMLGKDWIRQRVQSDDGISYTEFSYQILQALDFLHLLQEHDVRLQLGGSDQWGNITAGCDLVRKKTGKIAHGLTWPLLVKSDGKKFGKTEHGAIWLDQDQLSSADLYQHLIRFPDDMITSCLRKLTLLPLEQIEEWSNKLHPKEIQEKFAEELVRMLHGEKSVTEALAKKQSYVASDEISFSELLLQCSRITTKSSDTIGVRIVDVCNRLELITSKSECRRLMASKGFYLNGIRIEDAQFVVQADQLWQGKFLFIKLGKKGYQVLELI